MERRMKRSMMCLMTTPFLAASLLVVSQASAATDPNFVHPAVTLRDHNNGIAAGTGLPYSPKNSCGLASCHDYMAFNAGVDNVYESHWDVAAKMQWNRVGSTGNRDGVEISYAIPYPQHGVSAGYHFQQGRNIPWGGNQQDFYHVPEFTSSAGMFGKY